MTVKMGDDSDLRSIPLSSVPSKTLRLLSCLLNTPKIILSDDKLPRDWRGLASLINITSEYATYIKEYKDKTAKVLEYWMQKEAATVGQLLDCLKHIDRYDVYDDVCEDLREVRSKGESSVTGNKQSQSKEMFSSQTVDSLKPVTYDDRPGYEEQYHAFVLFAEEDRGFVDELQRRLKEEGFKICTVHSLQAGYSTKFGPISQLISERCQRIILVYSPEFLDSPANAFFTDYAQAVSIESRQRLIIPIMYRECHLPKHLTYYHNLYYKSEGRAMYDFWQKLKHSLDQQRAFTPVQSRVNGTTPTINIERLPAHDLFKDFDDSNLFLNVHSSMNHSPSLSCLDSLTVTTITDDSRSLSSLSQSSTIQVKKKKKNPFSRTFRAILGKKDKKEKNAIPVAN